MEKEREATDILN